MLTDTVSEGVLATFDVLSSVLTLLAVIVLVWQFASGFGGDGDRTKAKVLNFAFWILLAAAFVFSGLSALHLWGSVLWFLAAIVSVIFAFINPRDRLRG